MGSGEWAVLIVETLVSSYPPLPTAHYPGFRVRVKLGIGFPTGGMICLPFFIRAKKSVPPFGRIFVQTNLFTLQIIILTNLPRATIEGA